MNAVNTYQTKDKEANKKASIATAITALLLLISLVLITFSVDAKREEQEEGILVNFGTTTVGSGAIQPEQKAQDPVIRPPETSQVATPTPPKPQLKPKSTKQPEVKQKEVLTQKEETKVVTKPKQTSTPKSQTSTENNTSQKEVKTTTPSTSNAPAEPVTETKPAPKQPERTYPGGSKNTNSNGEGPNTGPGDAGQPDGSRDPGAYEGKNSGLGDSGIGYDLAGRKLVQAPTVNDNSNIEGKITVKIKVDQNGNVISASLGRPTTITNNTLIQKSIAAAKRAKFDQNRNASEEQFGTMTFIYKVQ